MLFGASGLAIILYHHGHMLLPQYNRDGCTNYGCISHSMLCNDTCSRYVGHVSEIFPNRIRGMAMAVSTLLSLGSLFCTDISIPFIKFGLGAYGTFWLYGIICILGFVFIKIKLPETKGKSLESIEKRIN